MQGAGTCDVPYCIVKSKARLGKLVNQKPVTAVAFTAAEKGDKDEHFCSGVLSSLPISKYSRST
jgi:ribosomal protein L7Ae-like RNA K-turn-binding protein